MNLPQTEAPFQPARERVIGDLDTLRIIADPLRLQILEVTIEAPRTVKQIGAILQTPVSKLYYHINLLEEQRLLQVVGTRVVSGIIEKQYRAAMLRVRFDYPLLVAAEASAGEALDLMISTLLDGTRLDLQHAQAAGLLDLSDSAPPERKVSVAKTLSRLSPAQAGAFRARLADLIKEFTDMYTPDADVQGYRLLVLMHPLQLSAPDEAPPDPAS